MVCRFPASGKRTLEQRGLGTFCRSSCLLLLLQQSPGEKLFPAAHFSTVPPLFYHQVKHNLCVVSPLVQRKLRCLRMLHSWGYTIRAHIVPLPRKGAGSVHPGACQQPGGPKCLREVLLAILLYHSSDRETPEPKQIAFLLAEGLSENCTARNTVSQKGLLVEEEALPVGADIAVNKHPIENILYF